MASAKRAASIVVVAMGAVLFGNLSLADAEAVAPTLTTVQQTKLKTIQEMFFAGGSTRSAGWVFEKRKEFCGAVIPVEVHPSTVAYETPVREIDRERISGLCQAAADALANECKREQPEPTRYRPDVGPPNFKKEIVANVKKLVCKATKNASEVAKTQRVAKAKVQVPCPRLPSWSACSPVPRPSTKTRLALSTPSVTCPSRTVR
jgi:hypothetical protein